MNRRSPLLSRQDRTVPVSIRESAVSRGPAVRTGWRAIVAFIAVLLLSGPVLACSVPVFRYALEHWRPDPYRAIVFHRGELTAEEQAAVAALNPGRNVGRPAVNLEVQLVDLEDEADETLSALWAEQQADALPWVTVQSPLRQGLATTVWAGVLSGENTSRLVESPVREELEQRLLKGDSVVWLFLDGGEREADDAAYELLQTEIARLQQVLELPEIEEADLGELSLDPAALKLKMSSLRVSRDDPAERMLVEMLLRVEPDLLDESFSRQPMAFPVFGRGRALYALVGNGIMPDTIEDACRFLTGACQCTVKAENPGVDLLMTVEWDAFIRPSEPDTTSPTLTGLAGFAAAEQTAGTDYALADPAGPGARAGGDREGETGSETASVDERDDLGDLARAAPDATAGSPPEAASTETPRTEVAGRSTPEPPLTASPDMTGGLLLVVGLLAVCVVVATMVLVPRSR